MITNEMNEIEKAIINGEFGIDLYLGEVSADQFKADIEDLKKRYANKEAIQQAVNQLQQLL